MLLLPLLNYLLVACPSLCFLCLLHGPPLLILGRWALQGPALINLVLEGCLLGFPCWLGSAEPRPSQLPILPPFVCQSTPLVTCSGYHLFLLCHPDCLITMAPVSMSLHVSYMRSLCTTEWRTGRQMILSVVRHGVAKEFMKFCAGLRVNK